MLVFLQFVRYNTEWKREIVTNSCKNLVEKSFLKCHQIGVSFSETTLLYVDKASARQALRYEKEEKNIHDCLVS